MRKLVEEKKQLSQYLVVGLLSSILSVLPMSSEVARATPNPSAISFANTICDLTTAGYAGSGSSSSPYLIPDVASLWEVSDCGGAGKYFELTQNINLSGSNDAPTSSPIGFTTSGNIGRSEFRGILDGKGFAIENVLISTSASTGFNGFVGLFWKLNLAEIRNLSVSGLVSFGLTTPNVDVGGISGFANSVTLSGVTSNIAVIGAERAGGLLGRVQSYATISSSVNRGDVSARAWVGGLIGDGAIVNISSSVNYGNVLGANNVGGLVGKSGTRAVIQDSRNEGDVTVTVGGSAGGLLGINENSPVQISGSQNYGNIGSTGSGIAGLVGWNGGPATISNSANFGLVQSSGQGLGGLTGYSVQTLTILNSQNSGEVRSIRASGAASAGGLAGHIDQALRVEASTNSATVSGRVRDIGGLVGRAKTTILMSSVQNQGSISGSNYVGGIIGFGDGASTFSSVANSGQVGGADYVGGIVGNLEGFSTLSSVHNMGRVSGATWVGGLIGQINNSLRMHLATNSGNVFAAGSNVGGLAGQVTGFANIEVGINTATISGTQRVGGLLGVATALLVHSRNTGQVAATANGAGTTVGGLVGRLSSGVTSSIISSHNAGSVSSGTSNGGDIAGGLVGQTYEGVVVSASFNLGTVTGRSQVAGLIGHQRYSKTATFTNAHNRGEVRGTEFVGGIVGDAEGTASISQAFNSGSILGTSYIAGLLGRISGSVEIMNAYNSGNISGETYVAGLVAYAQSRASMVNVYSSGDLSASSNIDSLVSRFLSREFVATNSSYTTLASVLAESKSISQLQLRSTFVNWDFQSIWGFGTCQENNGLPMLRFAELVSPFYSEGCYLAPTLLDVSQSPSVSPTPGLEPPARGYRGPMIYAFLFPTSPGETGVLDGIRLSGIISVFVGEAQATFSVISPVSLSIQIPGLLAVGDYDLVVFSSEGKLTVARALRVTIPKTVVPDPLPAITDKGRVMIGKTLHLPAFQKGQIGLSRTQLTWLRDRLSDTGLTRITCTGVIEGKMSMHQRIQVRQRAGLACQEVKRLLPNAETKIQSNSSRANRHVGGVLISFIG